MDSINKIQQAIIGQSLDEGLSTRLGVLYTGLTNVKGLYADQSAIEKFQLLNPSYDMTKVISPSHTLTYIPKWPMYVNAISAMVCLMLSALYHNFNYSGKKVMDKLSTLDYGGICILIMGSTYPACFYPFAC